jgi:Tfp pilus assembly protein PilF
MFVTDYERRSDERDIAAYRALGAMTAAICFCRQGKSEEALAVLTRALHNYERADSNLQQLKRGRSDQRCLTTAKS